MLDLKRIGPLYVKNPQPKIIERYYLETKDFFTDEITYLQLYVPYKEGILIPRFAYNTNNVELSDGIDIDIKCYAKPRDNIQKQATKFIIDNNECLINLAPRRGKTVISIMALCKIKKKTLILVDQTNLLEQWIDRIVEFTNLSKDDIGIFQSEKQQIDKPVIIGMVQSIKNHVLKNPEEIRNKFKDIGLTIVDEVHTIIGTEKLSLPLYSISSKRLVGLTATTYRSDNREYLFQEWFSTKIYSDKKYDIIPTIFMIPLNSYLTSKDEYYIMNNFFKTDKIDNQGKPIFSSKEFFNKLKWVKKIQKKKHYVYFISDLIRFFYNNNRTQLIISEYVDFLQIIAGKLLKLKMPKEDIELYSDSKGSTKSIKKYFEPSRNNDRKITLSTYKMCNKAIDRPDWDTLLMLTPVSSRSPSLEQTIGRVCTLCEGKQNAIVCDIYDESIPRLKFMAISRKKFYEELGCNVIDFSKKFRKDPNDKKESETSKEVEIFF